MADEAAEPQQDSHLAMTDVATELQLDSHPAMADEAAKPQQDSRPAMADVATELRMDLHPAMANEATEPQLDFWDLLTKGHQAKKARREPPARIASASSSSGLPQAANQPKAKSKAATKPKAKAVTGTAQPKGKSVKSASVKVCVQEPVLLQKRVDEIVGAMPADFKKAGLAPPPPRCT
jgi:hypothetical protein